MNKSQLPKPSRPWQEVKMSRRPSPETVHVPSFSDVLIFEETETGFVQRLFASFIDTTKSSVSLLRGPFRLVKKSCCSSAVSAGKYCMAKQFTVSLKERG